ncbi:MAG: hypothetical protein LUC93_00660 [Planctomycetaceae bacterium]|nr:hypothetical protein [Planctomycetaceae bacterium]
MTATESDLLVEQAIATLKPVLERFQNELFAPVLHRLLEMHALDAELEGMKAENTHRLDCGLSIAYGDEAFNQLAERYRALKETNQ